MAINLDEKIKLNTTYKVVYKSTEPLSREDVFNILKGINDNAIALTNQYQQIHVRPNVEIVPNTKDAPNPTHRTITVYIDTYANAPQSNNLSAVPLIIAGITLKFVVIALISAGSIYVVNKALNKLQPAEITEITKAPTNFIKWVIVGLALIYFYPLISPMLSGKRK